MDIDLRDYFAAKAMQVFLMDWVKDANGVGFANISISNVIDNAYYVADAMMKERQKL